MIRVKELFIYPIKSLKGISVHEAIISDTGFLYDRFWMLIDKNRNFYTQRDNSKLALFETEFIEGFLQVKFKQHSIKIPLNTNTKKEVECSVWGEKIIAYKENDEINNWFSSILNTELYLVRNKEKSRRTIESDNNSLIHFSDADQYLLLSVASMEMLNSKLTSELNINRFRANIVVSGAVAHEEDVWKEISIGESVFQSTNACSRCTITTVDQETSSRGLEPLKTLSTYRKFDNEVCFGHYYKLSYKGNKTVKTGDRLRVIRAK